MIEFSLYKIAKILLPQAKRKAWFMAWTYVFVSPLFGIIEQLRLYWDIEDRIAKMTPQVCFLEKYLNDKYNRTDIRIADGYELGPWAWKGGPPVGQTDLYMIEPYNYCYTEDDTISVDFVVKVPFVLESECNTIAAIVQYFKLAGKSFIIQLI